MFSVCENSKHILIRRVIAKGCNEVILLLGKYALHGRPLIHPLVPYLYYLITFKDMEVVILYKVEQLRIKLGGT